LARLMVGSDLEPRPPQLAVEKFAHPAPPTPPPPPPPPQAPPPAPPHPEDIQMLEAAAEEAVSTPGIGRPISRRATPFDLGSQRHASSAPWLIAAIASALLLIAQFVHHNREGLAAMFSKMGAPVSSASTLSVYQLRQWGVTGDPAGEGTLRVRASILNTAAQLEPYPLLRVTLANRFGGSIGTRDFEPSEYLGKPTAKLLAPGERVDATMDILDPGKNAEGFEIDVCLRGADRKVSCANDAAPAQAKR